jgi:AcrR family transcriptional regulator
MSPKIVNKEEKKRQILLAAMQVFSKKGLKNSRMVDIALAADIGKGTIYEYFRNREEILSEGFHLIMGDMESKIAESMSGLTHPEDKIKTMIEVTFDTLMTMSPDLMQIFLDFWSEGIRHRKETGEKIFDLESMYFEYRRMLSGILNDGIRDGYFRPMDTMSVASTIMAIIDGLLLQIILDFRALDQNKIVDEVINLVLNGIRKK